MEYTITPGRPVYVQLVEQLELGLISGEYPPGARIPPVRELAADAGVNPNTMQRALQELESRGLLQAQRTAGRTVTADDTVLQQLRQKRVSVVAQDCWHRLHALGLTAGEAAALVQAAAEAEGTGKKTTHEQNAQAKGSVVAPAEPLTAGNAPRNSAGNDAGEGAAQGKESGGEPGKDDAAGAPGRAADAAPNAQTIAPDAAEPPKREEK